MIKSRILEESWVLEWADSISIQMPVEVEMFESGKKSCRLKNIRIRVGGALVKGGINEVFESLTREK